MCIRDRLFAILGGIGGTYEGGAIEALSNPVSLVMLIPVVVMLVVATKSRNIFLGILVGLSLGLVTGLACGLFPPSAVFANCLLYTSKSRGPRCRTTCWPI